MKIAHFVQRYPPALGGSEAYFQRLSRHFAGRGHDVSVWTTNALDLEAFWSMRGQMLPAKEAFDNGVRVRRFKCWRWPLRRPMLKALSFFPGQTWKSLTMPCNPIAPDMWREAKRYTEPIDVVHAAAFPYAWPIVCARLLARRTNALFFITPFLHLGSPDVRDDRARRQYLAPHLQRLLRSADGIFVQTPSEHSAVMAIGIDASRVIFQGMGVEPEECTGGDGVRFRNSHGIKHDEIVVGHLANLSFEKGTNDLLIAASEAWKQGARFRLVLAGTSMPSFRRAWTVCPDKERITLTGVLDDQQKRDFFAGIDIFALPSRSDSFGLVLLEAWCNGVPNIAYRCGGIADVIRHEEDGLLVHSGRSDRLDPDSIHEFAAQLTRLTNNTDLRRRLGSAGRARSMREFGWADKLAIVERNYNAALIPAAERP